MNFRVVNLQFLICLMIEESLCGVTLKVCFKCYCVGLKWILSILFLITVSIQCEMMISEMMKQLPNVA